MSMYQGRKVDLSGEKFGKYTVIGDTPNRSKNGDRLVLARHENGELEELRVHELLNGKTTGYRKCKEKGEKLGKLNKEKYVNKDGVHLSSLDAEIRSDNKTGTKGVFFSNSKNRYIATLKVNKKMVLNKSFKTLDEAIKARKKAEEKHLEEAKKEYRNIKNNKNNFK